MAALIDSNVLVYRFDPRFPIKQEIATKLLRVGLSQDTVRIPHQALLEFVAVVSRTPAGNPALLPAPDARREAEEILAEFHVLYPKSALFRTALRGAAAYQLSCFDAHIWAYAEH